MVIKKKTWRDMKEFPELPGKILDIDGVICQGVRSLGKPVYLMRGLYVLHYYRMAEGRKYRDHLRDAELYLKNRPPRKRGGRRIPKNVKRNSKIIKTRRTHGRSLHIDNLQRDRLSAIQGGMVQKTGDAVVRD